MANVNKELEQSVAEVEAVKAELEASKAETETAKAEAEVAKAEAETAKAEAEALRAELEKLKTKADKNTGKAGPNKNQEKTEEEMVPVFLIKTKEKKDDFFCAINGHTYQIKRGEQVIVPKAVREIIKHQEKMDQIALENMEKANKNFA